MPILEPFARLFATGALAYSCWLAGRRYGTQWTVRGDRPGGAGIVLHLFLEIDPEAIGSGGPPIRLRARLEADEALRPLSYASEQDGKRLRLGFGAQTVSAELPDGSTQVIPRGDAAFAYDRAMPGLSAAMFASLAEDGILPEAATVRLFDVTQLTAFPYSFWREEAPSVATSHRELLEFDGHLLRQLALPGQGLEARHETRAPPVPAWRDAPLTSEQTRHYVPPDGRRFDLEDIVIAGPSVGLGATLTTPARPIASALFLSGSGTHDRHGFVGALDIGTHTIVDGLAEAGVSGLRFDTRGAGTTSLGDDALELGLNTKVADAQACLDLLRVRPETAGTPPFLIGHSEGGIVAMELAASSKDVAGIALLACPGRRIDEIIADQIVWNGERLGLSQAQVANQLSDLRELVRLVGADEEWNEASVPHHLLPAIRSRTFLQQHLTRTPTALLAQIACPVLICQGGKDFQVSVPRDAERLRDAAERAGLDVEYRVFPELDHLFKPIANESTMKSYFDPDRSVDGAVITSLADWIARTARRQAPPAVPR